MALFKSKRKQAAELFETGKLAEQKRKLLG